MMCEPLTAATCHGGHQDWNQHRQSEYLRDQKTPPGGPLPGSQTRVIDRQKGGPTAQSVRWQPGDLGEEKGAGAQGGDKERRARCGRQTDGRRCAEEPGPGPRWR